ncbi:MAG: energy transducer TonB [Thermonemataceae bacterium]
MNRKLLICLTCIIFIVTNSVTAQDTTIYKMADKQPEPIGGLKAFYEYIESNLQYPEEAKQLKLQGRVMVKFVVETDGKISEVSVMKGIGGGCDEEAVRLIQKAPNWIPGRKDGKPVRVEVVRPITFKLDF